MAKPYLLLICFIGLPGIAYGEENPLVGLWAYDEDPIWIEIQFVDGIGTGVYRRNDEFPEKVGFALLKDIEATGREGQWRVKIFADRMGEYKAATITMLSADSMRLLVKVGVISKRLHWQRAENYR